MTVKIFWHIAWLGLLLPFSFASAQQTQPKHPSSAATNAGGAAKREAATEVARLGKMIVGTWDLSGTSEASTERPKVRHDTGRSIIKYGPGRLSLMEDFRMHGDSGELFAIGTFWWDAQAHGFRTMFCETRDPSGCSVYDGLGHWEGANLVNRWVFEDNGKRTVTKQVVEEATPNEFIATFYNGDGDATLKKSYTYKHTRTAQAQ